MQLLTKPSSWNLKTKTEYESFGFFKLALTERNWVGQQYIEKRDCDWFINELREFNNQFNQLFSDTESVSDLHFLIDLSLFTGDLSSNFKLLEFLEELEDLIEVAPDDVEKTKKAIKYKKKLRAYASKLDNIPYVYRWLFTHTDHPFTSEIKGYINEILESSGTRDMNKFVKFSENAFKVFIFKNRHKNNSPLELMKSPEFVEMRNRIFTQNHTQHTEVIQSLFKYCFDEPSLFFYASYASHLYFKQAFNFNRATGGVMSEKKDLPTFILFERPETKIEVTVDTTAKSTVTLYLQQQSFVTSLLKDDDLSYSSLAEVSMPSEDEESEKIELLKTIVDWASKRIPNKLLDSDIFAKQWVHVIEDEFFTDMEIQGMTFKDNTFLTGKHTAEELLVKVVAMTDSDKPILFPMLDTSSWDGLNSRQCALIAYAVCLYHDISFPHNYELIPIEDIIDVDDVETSPVRYGLFIKNKHTTKSSRAKNTTYKETNHQTDESKETRKTEHWVSFHFRRLPKGRKSTEEAKRKASKYGFASIPSGFTFIDSFIKGEKPKDETEMKISAVDVLSKTLEKLEEIETTLG